jgi:hypothetical protein
MHAVATTSTEVLTRIVRPHQHLRPSLFFSQIGFRITLFEACSAFTLATAVRMAVEGPEFADIICFHAEQCAENR